MDLKELLEQNLLDGTVFYLVLSGLRHKTSESFSKVTVKPMLLKGELSYQFTYHYTNKVTHQNARATETLQLLLDLWQTTFKQGQIYSSTADYQVFINKDDSARVLSQPPTRQAPELQHNRKKEYLLAEGTAHDFLVRLGVMNAEGKVLAQKYDKYRQINRFVELVADVADKLPHPEGRPLRIVDFGSGKSYLTFALYYYLRVMKAMDVEILGLDLKQDVIADCSRIARDLGYSQLQFVVGDIASYQGLEQVDMVVTLHACDTATDDALAKAVAWGAEVILSVPCCQHELAKQLHNPILRPMEKHGIIKERLAALVTDSLRASVLEIVGYDVQLVEFIDMEHTPKNVMIRALKHKQRAASRQAVQEYLSLRDFCSLQGLYIEQAFGSLLTDSLQNPE